jgi:hypothetical protein
MRAVALVVSFAVFAIPLFAQGPAPPPRLYVNPQAVPPDVEVVTDAADKIADLVERRRYLPLRRFPTCSIPLEPIPVPSTVDPAIRRRPPVPPPAISRVSPPAPACVAVNPTPGSELRLAPEAPNRIWRAVTPGR